MKLTKSLLFTLLLLIIASGIHIYSANAGRVEGQYSTGIYPAFSSTLRYIFGWLPFSIGDLVYGLVILWLLWKLIKAIKAVLKKQVNLKNFTAAAKRTLQTLLVIYILFNLFWGINYNRVGIARQLSLPAEKYTVQELHQLNAALVERVNATKSSLVSGGIGYPTKRQLFEKVRSAYDKATVEFPFLAYQPHSLKPSLWSWLGNYMGFTGYYNPFTGEAQVNTLVPEFLQPFTTCHEVAHQLGYAKEMEASFVGYLVAARSQDTLLQYSVYLDLFMYGNRNLFETDSSAAKQYRSQLTPEVKADLAAWKAFTKKYKNPVEPVFRWIYGKYLEGNQQPQGVLSYDEVTGLVIAWYKKNGRL